jgi:hypothetical protein
MVNESEILYAWRDELGELTWSPLSGQDITWYAISQRNSRKAKSNQHLCCYESIDIG